MFLFGPYRWRFGSRTAVWGRRSEWRKAWSHPEPRKANKAWASQPARNCSLARLTLDLWQASTISWLRPPLIILAISTSCRLPRLLKTVSKRSSQIPCSIGIMLPIWKCHDADELDLKDILQLFGGCCLLQHFLEFLSTRCWRKNKPTSLSNIVHVVESGSIVFSDSCKARHFSVCFRRTKALKLGVFARNNGFQYADPRRTCNNLRKCKDW